MTGKDYHSYSEKQAAITRTIHLFLANMSKVSVRAAREVPGLESVLELEFLNQENGWKVIISLKIFLKSSHKICFGLSDK